MLKRAPWSGVLSTSISPPMRSTIRREIAQTEPRTAVTGRASSVTLLEFIEQRSDAILRNARPGINHVQDEPAILAVIDRDADSARFGEFHGVAGKN